MRISDWSSDVCSSDLPAVDRSKAVVAEQRRHPRAGIWPLMLRVMGGRLAGDPCDHQRLEPSDRIAFEAADGLAIDIDVGGGDIRMIEDRFGRHDIALR